MSSNLLTGCSEIVLPDLEKIANESQLVIRKSHKFSLDAFLQSLLSSVGSGLASFNQMAANLKERVPEPMARQSLHERFSHKSTSFLLKVLDDLMTQRFKPAASALKGSQIRRLIAIRASQETAEKRSRDRKAKAKKNGTPPSAKGPIRDRWHLIVTNLEKNEVTSTKIVEIYRTRWAIEIQFRAWKQSLNLSKALHRKSNQHHLEGLVLAAMIAHQLGMKVAEVIVTHATRSELSFEKLYDILAQHIQKAKRFADLLDFSPDKRHIIRDKRKRKSPIESGLTALT